MLIMAATNFSSLPPSGAVLSSNYKVLLQSESQPRKLDHAAHIIKRPQKQAEPSQMKGEEMKPMKAITTKHPLYLIIMDRGNYL